MTVPRDGEPVGETVWTSQLWTSLEVRVTPLARREGGAEGCGCRVVRSRYRRTWSRVRWSLFERRRRMMVGIMRESTLMRERRSLISVLLVTTVVEPFNTSDLIEQREHRSEAVG